MVAVDAFAFMTDALVGANGISWTRIFRLTLILITAQVGLVRIGVRVVTLTLVPVTLVDTG